jgi:uncharacterized glyoxalase superfamily protein PhnB
MARPFKPQGWPQLIPALTVADPKKSIEFYKKAFGFQLEGQPMEMEGKIVHAELKFQEAKIMLGGEGCGELISPKTSGVRPGMSLYLYCENPDRIYESALKAGAKSEAAPEDMFWGDRACRVTDPDGYVWWFAKNVADFDPSKIPQEASAE